VTHSFLAPASAQSNATRLRAWAIRVFEHIETEYAWLFEEYAPSQWRIRLPASGVDIPLAIGDKGLIFAARKWFKLLRNEEIRWAMMEEELKQTFGETP
jgi:hypothetical protein